MKIEDTMETIEDMLDTSYSDFEADLQKELGIYNHVQEEFEKNKENPNVWVSNNGKTQNIDKLTISHLKNIDLKFSVLFKRLVKVKLQLLKRKMLLKKDK